MDNVPEDELEELRKKKLLALQQQMTDKQKKEQGDTEKEELLKKILTIEARQRLANLKIVKKEFIEQLELQIILLAQQRKIPIPLPDEQLKQILIQLQGPKREIKIRRR